MKPRTSIHSTLQFHNQKLPGDLRDGRPETALSSRPADCGLEQPERRLRAPGEVAGGATQHLPTTRRAQRCPGDGGKFERWEKIMRNVI